MVMGWLGSELHKAEWSRWRVLSYPCRFPYLARDGAEDAVAVEFVLGKEPAARLLPPGKAVLKLI